MKIDAVLREKVRTEAIKCGLLYPTSDVHQRDIIVSLLDGASVYSKRPYGVHIAVLGTPTHLELMMAAENGHLKYFVSLRPIHKDLIRYGDPIRKYTGLYRAVRALLDDCVRQAGKSTPQAA